MELDEIIKQSLLKLEKSFDALDNALLKQANGVALQANLSQDIDLLVQDRSQLASQLDDAKAKIDSLQNMNQFEYFMDFFFLKIRYITLYYIVIILYYIVILRYIINQIKLN